MVNSIKRRVFYSFHYAPDNWRASQVRNIGVIEGNRPATDNDWEQVKRGGDAAIQRWIDSQLTGTSCTIVLIGSQTAGRKWINYEVIKSWDDGKGIFGIYIHGLKNSYSQTGRQGNNPFDLLQFDSGASLSTFVPVYNPTGFDSTDVYASIERNLSLWVEDAIARRSRG